MGPPPPDNAPAYTDFAIEQDHGIKFADMVGVAYEDPKWEQFLDQLTLQQMTSIAGENFGQPAIDAIAKPANANSDGPAGPQGSYPFGENYSTTVHVGEAVAQLLNLHHVEIAVAGDYLVIARGSSGLIDPWLDERRLSPWSEKAAWYV